MTTAPDVHESAHAGRVRAALFFAAEAPYVTGQILAVDGGRSANA